MRIYEGEIKLGLILDETKDYALVIGLSYVGGSGYTECYCIRNKLTHVDEFQVPTLPKARFILPEAQKDMDEGFERHAKALGRLGSMFQDPVDDTSGYN